MASEACVPYWVSRTGNVHDPNVTVDSVLSHHRSALIDQLSWLLCSSTGWLLLNVDWDNPLGLFRMLHWWMSWTMTNLFLVIPFVFFLLFIPLLKWWEKESIMRHCSLFQLNVGLRSLWKQAVKYWVYSKVDFRRYASVLYEKQEEAKSVTCCKTKKNPRKAAAIFMCFVWGSSFSQVCFLSMHYHCPALLYSFEYKPLTYLPRKKLVEQTVLTKI